MLKTSPLRLTRPQILAFRRSVQALDERLPQNASSLRRAAWAGLQDSMPRAAVLSLHARVRGTTPMAWESPSLVQLWGPRYSAFVAAEPDAAIFTLGRLPDTGSTRRVAEDLANRLAALLGDTRMLQGAAARALGEIPNRLRYATLTGRIRIRWDGAKQPTIWMAAGAIAGTWRRADAAVSIETWRRLSRVERDTVEAEVASLPIPGAYITSLKS